MKPDDVIGRFSFEPLSIRSDIRTLNFLETPIKEKLDFLTRAMCVACQIVNDRHTDKLTTADSFNPSSLAVIHRLLTAETRVQTQISTWNLQRTEYTERLCFTHFPSILPQSSSEWHCANINKLSQHTPTTTRTFIRPRQRALQQSSASSLLSKYLKIKIHRTKL